MVALEDHLTLAVLVAHCTAHHIDQTIRGKVHGAGCRQQQAIAKGRGHWVEAFDPSTFRVYFRHSKTHEVTWEQPKHYVMTADDKEMHAVVLLQTRWRMRAARRVLSALSAAR